MVTVLAGYPEAGQQKQVQATGHEHSAQDTEKGKRAQGTRSRQLLAAAGAAVSQLKTQSGNKSCYSQSVPE